MLDGSSSSYKNLEELSNQTARMLINLGIKHGNVVAIFNNKSVEAFAIMIACLKTGIIYTNLDNNNPGDRLYKILNICKPSLILSPSAHYHKILESKFHVDLIMDYQSEKFRDKLKDSSTELLINTSQVTGNTPAYIMFTSGSTGFPKGVVITHSNVLNFIKWSKITYKTSPGDIFTNINPMYFDNSVFDFYSSIFTGACLIPVNEELTKNPRKLIELLNLFLPTIWFSVPSMLVYSLKLRAINKTDLPSLRIVSFGGEGFPKNQLRNLWNFWGDRVKFINVYGPTECTCICSSFEVTKKEIDNDELLPLGPIASNFGQLIIDENGRMVENDEIGELWITGPNVGLGYINNPEKTKDVFIQNPFNDSYRDIIYKSGDLVKFNSIDNLIYFSGRKDNQIKRMGYRIELEEIENALASLDYIEENAVIYINNNYNETSGKIIGCVRSINVEESRIIKDLEKIIPSYMLPNEFRFYEHLPKNQNGKIDRLQLKLDFVE